MVVSILCVVTYDIVVSKSSLCVYLHSLRSCEVRCKREGSCKLFKQGVCIYNHDEEKAKGKGAGTACGRLLHLVAECDHFRFLCSLDRQTLSLSQVFAFHRAISVDGVLPRPRLGDDLDFGSEHFRAYLHV